MHYPMAVHLFGLHRHPCIDSLPTVQCNDYIQHYQRDAVLFDYFEEKSGADRDSARRIQQAVSRRVHVHDGECILDVGSGNGWLAQRFERSNCTVVSCDISVQNLKTLKARDRANHFFIAADAHRLPFRGGAFATLVASEVVEHLNDPLAFTKESHRILMHDGRIVVSVPYKEVIRYYLCIHCNEQTPANAHLHSFDETTLRSFLASAGFTDVSESVMSNRMFLASRVSYTLRFLPYFLWRVIDRATLILYNRATILLATARKRSTEETTTGTRANG